MTIARERLVDLVSQLPEQVDVEELIYRLYLQEKLAAAEQDVAAGRTISTSEMRAQAAAWRK